MTKSDNAIKVQEFYFNSNVIKTLLNADPTLDNYPSDLINIQSQIMLKAMLSDTTRNKQYKCLSKSVTYTKKAYGDLKFGRYTSKGSIQNVWQRKAILAGRVIGFDIINSQPSIVFDLTQKFIPNQTFPCLERCVKHRESVRSEIMDLYGCDKDEAKRLLIRIGFGGSQTTWETDNKLEHKHSQFVSEYESEVTKIKTEFAPLYFPKYCDATAACKWKHENEKIPKHKKESNTQFALFLQNCEGNIMRICNNYFKDNGEKVCGIIHDEILIVDSLEVDNDKIVFELQKQVLNHLGHDILFEWEKYETTPQNKLLIERHKEFSPELDYAEEYDLVKMKFEQTSFKIVNTAEFASVDTEGTLIISKRSDFMTMHEGSRYVEDDKSCDFLQRWFKDSTIRKYDRVDMLPPPLDCPSHVYNIWNGFAIENIESDGDGQEGLALILDLINTLCDFDDIVYEYVIDWLAHMIQFAGKKNGIALLFKSSGHGAGKGTLINLLRKMMGNNLVAETSNPQNDIFGNHGNVHIGRLLVSVDEVKCSDTNKQQGRLKNIITSERCTYNEKGRKQCEVSNLTRFIFTTNESIPICIEQGDRRMCVIESSNKYCGEENQPHWKNFQDKVFEKTAGLKSFFDFLNTRDISERNFSAIPKTKLKEDLQESTKNPMFAWFDQLVHYQTEDTQKYRQAELAKHFTAHMQMIGMNAPSETGRFTLIFNQLIYTPMGGQTGCKTKGYKMFVIDRVQAFEWLTKMNFTEFPNLINDDEERDDTF